MAVIAVAKVGRTVNTISDRNSISLKPDGLIVNVKDAIGDPAVGGGSAIYKWRASDEKWVLVSKERRDIQHFNTEIKNIDSDGKATLDNTPTSSILWNIQILNEDKDLILDELSSVEIDGNVITGLDEYTGKNIKCTYAYGDITDSLDALLNALKNKDNDLQSQINDEVSRASTKESEIENNVNNNTNTINVINADEDTDGSFRKGDKEVTDNCKAYTDSKKDEAINEAKDYTDNQLTEFKDNDFTNLKNTVETINGDSDTDGSFRKAIKDLIGGAPEVLDTLKELADAINNDEDVYNTLLTKITNNENIINTINNDEDTDGSFRKGDKDTLNAAKDYTNNVKQSLLDNEIKTNKDRLDTLEADENTDGSIAKADKEVLENANSYTDNKITEVDNVLTNIENTGNFDTDGKFKRLTDSNYVNDKDLLDIIITLDAKVKELEDKLASLETVDLNE